nr:ferritin, chloroplastic-like [Ipomoea batatas]
MPPPEFDNNEKGDALHAMELALSLEKLVNGKLLNLYAVADKNNDAELQDFVEREFLEEQSKSGVIMLFFSDISTSDVNFYKRMKSSRSNWMDFCTQKDRKLTKVIDKSKLDPTSIMDSQNSPEISKVEFDDNATIYLEE